MCHVPLDIRQKTLHCFFSFACISGKRNARCEAVSIGGENFIVLDRPPDTACGYLSCACTDYICTCPVHYYVLTHRGLP